MMILINCFGDDGVKPFFQPVPLSEIFSPSQISDTMLASFEAAQKFRLCCTRYYGSDNHYTMARIKYGYSIFDL